MTGRLIQFKAGVGQISDKTADDLELRVAVCGHCGKESPALDRPLRDRWMNSHRCGVRGDAA